MFFSEQLFESIRRNDNENVRTFLEKPCRYPIDPSGKTLLHLAAEHGNYEIARFLLSMGSDVDAQDSAGVTPLMMAVVHERPRIVALLLKSGADVETANRNDETALHVALAVHGPPSVVDRLIGALRRKRSGGEETAQWLTRAGCQLHRAVCLREPRVLECMIKLGAHVDSADPLSGRTALHKAVIRGDVACVKWLLLYNADARLTDDLGATPLYYSHKSDARQEDQLEILEFLLQRGVSLTSRLANGRFQVEVIAREADREAVRAVLRSGIDFGARDASNRSLLHYLANNANPGVIEEMTPYMHEFDVNEADEYRFNSAFWPMQAGNAEMLEFLLSRGADANLVSCVRGTTPLYWLFSIEKAERRHERCAELLLQYGADPRVVVTERDGRPSTVFDLAVKTSDWRKARLAIAQLAIREMQGEPIGEVVRAKIHAQTELREYFERCRRNLERKIAGKVTVFKLLTESKAKLARYLNNDEVVERLERIGNNEEVKLNDVYYYNTIRKRLFEAIEYKRKKNVAAEMIWKIFEERLDKNHIIVVKIADYLDDDTLQNCVNFQAKCR